MFSFILGGCAKLQELSQDTRHTKDEVSKDIDGAYEDYKASYLENSLVKLFSDCDTTFANRKDNYISWESASSFSASPIINNYLRKNSPKIKERDISTQQKMQILKHYFLDKEKDEHIANFKKSYKKPKFDKFKSDSENIDMVNEYKLKLSESQHQWRMNLDETKIRVADAMFSTLYGEPKLKFNSFDTFWNEGYFSVSSSHNNFTQEIKIKVEPEIAREMEKNIESLKPFVFFNFSDNSLKYVGTNLIFKKKIYCSDDVDKAYIREDNIVFVDDDEEISLKSIEVNYTQIIKNIKPPKWFRQLHEEGFLLGYGEGKTISEAKAQARAEIIETLEVSVESSIVLETQTNGSSISSSSNSKVKSVAKKTILKGSKVIRDEKKDGIYFVAVKYRSNL